MLCSGSEVKRATLSKVPPAAGRKNDLEDRDVARAEPVAGLALDAPGRVHDHFAGREASAAVADLEQLAARVAPARTAGKSSVSGIVNLRWLVHDGQHDLDGARKRRRRPAPRRKSLSVVIATSRPAVHKTTTAVSRSVGRGSERRPWPAARGSGISAAHWPRRGCSGEFPSCPSRRTLTFSGTGWGGAAPGGFLALRARRPRSNTPADDGREARPGGGSCSAQGREVACCLRARPIFPHWRRRGRRFM